MEFQCKWKTEENNNHKFCQEMVKYENLTQYLR